MYRKELINSFLRFLKMATVTAFLYQAVWTPSGPVRSQRIDGGWEDFENISRTPTSSTYPSITADTAGNVHVFWSEDVGGRTQNPILRPDNTPEVNSFGDPINYLYDMGNSLFYTRWNGKGWTNPIDIQYNSTGQIAYPRAAVDSQGLIHVVYLGSTAEQGRLMYTRAPVAEAGSANGWSKPISLADNILASSYPIDIAADLSGGIHVLYFQLGRGSGAYIINTLDGGRTWSEPVLLFSTNDPLGEREGISPTRLVSDTMGRLHATWTVYNSVGNGKAVYYSQSRDHGQTWSEPFEVATWQPDWYEVDWLNAGIAGDEIHLVWEGSSRVAAQVERISQDGGLTWSEPRYILPNLVGENGFANLVTDSSSNLHLLVAKRGDPASLSNGVWYTQWDRGQWDQPRLLGTPNENLYEIAGQLGPEKLSDLLRNTLTGNGLRYPDATIVNGNELFLVVVNEYDGEIWSSHTELNAPALPAQPYIYPTATPLPSPTAVSQLAIIPTPVTLSQFNDEKPVKTFNFTTLLYLGALPALVIVVAFLFYSYLRNMKGQ